MEKQATRDAYGQALVELGQAYDDVVVLDADLSKSTKTADFAKAFPERFFNAGIAEQNMMGMAAGMAASGRYHLPVHLPSLLPGALLNRCAIPSLIPI